MGGDRHGGTGRDRGGWEGGKGAKPRSGTTAPGAALRAISGAAARHHEALRGGAHRNADHRAHGRSGLQRGGVACRRGRGSRQSKQGGAQLHGASGTSMPTPHSFKPRQLDMFSTPKPAPREASTQLAFQHGPQPKHPCTHPSAAGCWARCLQCQAAAPARPHVASAPWTAPWRQQTWRPQKRGHAGAPAPAAGRAGAKPPPWPHQRCRAAGQARRQPAP